MAAATLLSALTLPAGCVPITEQHTETILSRQRVELAPRRQAASDGVLIDAKWDGGQLVLRVLRESGYVADVVDRQSVDKKTIRKLDSWVPSIAEGAISVVAIGIIIAMEDRKAKCTPDGRDAGCGFGEGFAELGAVTTLITTSVGLLINVGRSADSHKVETRDITTGTTVPHSAFAPASAARVALRWADGTELSATTDADGVVRLSVPPERADPHAAPAALIVDDRRIRDIHPGAVGAP
jgi:hypothetical protein